MVVEQYVHTRSVTVRSLIGDDTETYLVDPAVAEEIEQLRAKLEDARTHAVMTLAFLDRDRGTDRQETALDDIIKSARKLNQSILDFLSVQKRE